MSEPVNTVGLNSTGLRVTNLDWRSPLGIVTSGGSSASEFTITLDSSSYQPKELAVTSVPRFELTGIQDMAIPAVDRHVFPGDPYSYRFPSPKYPTDYTYKEYVFVRDGTPASGTAVTGTTAQPNNLAADLSSRLGTGIGSNRVTDVLISIPPADGKDDRFFIWPTYARYTDSPAIRSPDQSAKGVLEDVDIIWDFGGKKYLEHRPVTIHGFLNTHNNPGGNAEDFDIKFPSPQLVFEFNIPGLFKAGPRNGSEGLWLPAPADDSLMFSPPILPTGIFRPGYQPDRYYTGIVPEFHPFGPGKQIAPNSDSGVSHFYYDFLQTDYLSPSMVDFVFHLGASVDPELYAARLHVSPGAPIPPNWYRLVRPFSFEIHDITRQRSGVTILNNVINPNNGESTYVHYQLVKGGQVTIQVFTLDGTMVDILYRGHRDSGEYRAVWGGKNRGGRAVARGMYFIRVVGPDIDEIRKVMVVK
jgi:hypothetical protein